ncbi:40S ribosomal protein S8 [Melia azedarach]|uniref:40S ribosomal protein S8 n=1 Tax=Melia azedarach TaxID=155640 RepID=A0ACC1YMX0_MELAZ|nr:40S ribosomal protein S8 [Melia azedarach]
MIHRKQILGNAIVEVDASAPFKKWYLQHYGVDIGRKKKAAAATKNQERKKERHILAGVVRDEHIEEQGQGIRCCVKYGSWH